MKGNRPRVLHCVTHLSLGGAERVALDLARGLQGEFEPAVLAIRGTAANACGASLAQELRDARIPLFSGLRVPMKLGGMLTGAWAVGRAVRAFQPDVVHVHTEIPEAAVATYWRLGGPKKTALVRTIHNSVYWEFWRSLGRRCEQVLGSAHSVAVSAGALAALQKLRAEVGTTGGRTELIFNGVPPAPRQTDPQRVGPMRVIYGGRLEPEKGTDLLPEILARVPAPEGGAEFDLFGQGAHEERLRTWAKTPPTGWRIRVWPPIADFRARLADYDVCVVPSRFEGFGLVAVEALMAGLAVVTTDCPGLREVVPAGYPWQARTESIDSLAETLGRALRDARTPSPERGQFQAELQQRFSLAHQLDRHAAFYRAVLALSRGEHPPGSP